MPTLSINGNIRTNTAAGWAVDATVYSAKTILVTTDATYGATDQRKFKIADGTQTWSNLDYFPVSGYDDATSSVQTQLNNKQPLDSDLTTIAGLSATTDNFIQSKSNAWASRTPAQVSADLTANLLIGYQGYTIQGVSAIFNPADSTTYYFGSTIQAPTTSAAVRRLYVTKPGTVTAVFLYISNLGTLGTGESNTVNFRLNNTTDTLISNAVTTNATSNVASNTALSIAVVAGDYFEIKIDTPAYATNPTNLSWNAVIYIQ